MLVLLLACVFCFALGDEPYFRFWSGYKLDALSRTEFLAGLDWFLNQTTHISNCGGLQLYVVPFIDTSDLPPFVPDEIALLQYKSADLYHSFYSTPIGRYYQGLHAKFFNMSRSASLVPEDYKGDYQTGHAYCVPNCNFTWTDLFAASSIVQNSNGIELLALSATVDAIINSTRPAAIVVGVYENYVKFVIFFTDDASREAAKNSVSNYMSLLGSAAGPIYQIAENVVPPLNVSFGTTVNVTIGPCTLNATK